MKFSAPVVVSLLAFALTALSTLFAQAEPASAAAKADVLRADEARLHAQLSASTGTLDALLTPDCLYIHSSGRTQTKSELLEELTTGTLRYRQLNHTAPPRVRIYADNAAIVTGTMQLEVDTPAGSVKRTLVTTCVYVRTNGRWQLASYHSGNAAP